MKLYGSLRKSNQELPIHDLGAGTRVGSKQTIGKIARISKSNWKLGLMLRHLSITFNYKNILELGTSLGFTTLLLSEDPNGKVTTIEGNPHIAAVAQDNFEHLMRKNIKQIIGDIDAIFDQVTQPPAYDLIFVDANHTYEATLRYIKKALECIKKEGIIVIADIYWSRGMKKAWEELIKWNEITVSIDLFEAGIIFVDQKLSKQHFTLRF